MDTVNQIKLKLYPIFEKYPVKKAVLFGSYAKGIAHEKSDIDIMVDSGLRGMAFFGLLEDVATSLDKSVDLLDSSEIEHDSEVDREIRRTGVLIYER